MHEGVMLVPDMEAQPTKEERKVFLRSLGFDVKDPTE